ncbi:MAG: D-lyxose/D-mannose family sugar isomerase [Bacteroidetes bacterium]|nr:D-lyxose/D-mannose family sugar isomerase [Bacteroidota bacterium]
MKRSEVNSIIKNSIDFFEEYKFWLPEWAYWSPENWKGQSEPCAEIITNNLGWDITDFGSNDFTRQGLVLFTIRNGNLQKKDKTYCEKIMIADEEQETPLHFHWNKMEDIINRGGGNLVLELFIATSNGELTDKTLDVNIDGIISTVKPGEQLILKPGQSICMKPYQYHRFYGQKGFGKVLIGEVSMVNDDENDNRFYERVGRFPAITEDSKPLHLLVSDYQNYL